MLSFDALYDLIGRVIVSPRLGYFFLGYRGAEMIDHVYGSETKLFAVHPPAAPMADRYEHTKEIISEFIENPDNIRKDFSIDTLAEATGLSHRRINYYFSHELGMEFRVWKVNVKIRRAMQIMEDDLSLTIAEVASLVGFKDKSNFHRQFLRVTGETPAKWRKDRYRPK